MKRAVLIADDHPLFRDALKLAVAQAVPGAHIIEADSVHSLFAALETNPDPELLLLDLNMPGAQGFNALVQARAHFPAVPIVVISAREDRHIMHRALGHGAAAFVPADRTTELLGGEPNRRAVLRRSRRVAQRLMLHIAAVADEMRQQHDPVFGPTPCVCGLRYSSRQRQAIARAQFANRPPALAG